ncbi:unnamed protein product, partial [Nesidiocoris tenuis]
MPGLAQHGAMQLPAYYPRQSAQPPTISRVPAHRRLNSQPIRDAIATAGPAHRRLQPPAEKDSIVECFRPAIAAPSRCGLSRPTQTAPRLVFRLLHLTEGKNSLQQQSTRFV